MLRVVTTAVLLLLAGCSAPSEPSASPEPTSPVVPSPAPEASPDEPAATPVQEPPTPCLRAPVEGFVDLAALDPPPRLDVRYATADNFTGAPLDGYGAAGAWLVAPAAEALAAVQRDLAADGLELLVYDAYRPRRGTAAMVTWAEGSGNEWVLEQGYVARKSGHNHGHTVDLTIVDAATGEPWDMGSPWDHFGAESHYTSAEGEVLERRRRLRDAMGAHGWRPYSKEWWHFGLRPGNTRPRDVPYGCDEADEG